MQPPRSLHASLEHPWCILYIQSAALVQSLTLRVIHGMIPPTQNQSLFLILALNHKTVVAARFCGCSTSFPGPTTFLIVELPWQLDRAFDKSSQRPDCR